LPVGIGTPIWGCEFRLEDDHGAVDKHPRKVEFLDALPKGPTGKILKRELRK